MTKPMLTKNIDKLRQEVAAHVAADSIVQGFYWNKKSQKGCFIGCLAHSDKPSANEVAYGLPIMVQRIAENIFEALNPYDAKAFFAALPDAVGCNGKDLSKVGWQFLAAEFCLLPKQSAQIQVVIDRVIAGMDLLSSGEKWDAAAYAAAADADAAAAAYADAATAAAAADAAAAAAYAAYAAADAAAAAAAAYAAAAAAYAADAAADAAAAYAADAAAVAVRLRQRDLLLQLISTAPVVEVCE